APQRANRFGVPLRSTRCTSNPALPSISARRTSAPPSSGVTEGQRIRRAVRSATSVICLHPDFNGTTNQVQSGQDQKHQRPAPKLHYIKPVLQGKARKHPGKGRQAKNKR